MPTSKATQTPSLKIAREGRLEGHLIAKRFGHITHHGRSLLSSTKGTLSNMLATKNGWTKSQRSSHAAHRPSAFGMHSTRTEKHPHFNFQEQILSYERDSIICPWEDRNRTFEEFVSKNPHYNLRARCIVDPQASPLMKVPTEIESHEQEEKGETTQEANFAVDLKDSKVYTRWDVLHTW